MPAFENCIFTLNGKALHGAKAFMQHLIDRPADEIISPKTETDAPKIEEPGKMDVGQPPENGSPMGKGDTQPQEPAQQGPQKGEPKEEVNPLSNNKTKSNENEKSDQNVGQPQHESSPEKTRAGSQENEKARPGPQEGLKQKESEGPGNTGANSPKTTSIKNAVVNEERRKRNLSEIENELKRGYGDVVLPEAKRAMESGEIDPTTLTDGILKNPKTPITDTEEAILALHRMQLHNQHQTLLDAQNEAEAGAATAREKGDEETALDYDTQAAKARINLLLTEDQLVKNDEASKKSGTAGGRSLKARQAMIAQDYSLAHQIAVMQAESGKPISDELRTRLEGYSKELDRVQKLLADREAKIKELETGSGINKMKAEARSAKRAATVLDIHTKRTQIIDKIKAAAREQAGTLSANPIPLKMVGMVAELAKTYVDEGVVKAADLVDKVYNDLKDHVAGLSKRDVADAISGYGKTPQRQTRSEIDKQFADTKSQLRLISKIEDVEKGLSPEKKAAAKPSPEVQALRDKLFKAMKKAGVPYNATDPVAVFKKRLESRTKDLQEKIDNKDFTTVQRPKVVYDNETAALQMKLQRVKDKFDLEKEKLRKANRTPLRRYADWVLLWRRASLLSSTTVLAKLQMAAIYRTITTPMEEIAGSVLNHIPGISAIAKGAPREGGSFNFRAEAKAISQWWNPETYKDFKNIFKTGKSAQDVLYGKHKSLPPETMEMIGHIHAILKSPVKKAEFYRSLEKRLSWAAEHGQNIYDPTTQFAVASKAYLDANRSIFMQDNLLTKGFQSLMGTWHNSGTSGQMAEAISRFMLPMIKVATNVPGEAATLVAGAANPAVLRHIATAMMKGVDELSPDEKDFVMRSLKKNAVGVAAMYIGYHNYQNFGGFYHAREHRKEGDVKANEFRIGGHDLPVYLLDAPIWLAMQFGATLHRVQDEFQAKGTKGGTVAGIAHGTEGLFENVPFLNLPQQMVEVEESDNAGGVAAGALVGSLIPGLSRNIATYIDKGRHPRPASFWQTVEMNIPVLRGQVPEKKQKKQETEEVNYTGW